MGLLRYLFALLGVAVLHDVTLAMAGPSKLKYIMYLTGQHVNVPELPLVADLTHVTLAFMRPMAFNVAQPTSWPMWTSDAISIVAEQRNNFAPGTKMIIGIGGWGDTAGFSEGAKTDDSRKLFAKNIVAMLEQTGADGVDIDWEYPGGNGEDYKTTPNSEKAWEIEAYPKLLSEIRSAVGSSRIISAAVPGLQRDMLAFTSTTIPEINKYVDEYNIMTYDMMNRRDNVTKHHTGLQLSLEAIDTYIERGVPPEKANLGFAFYVKWFMTDPNANCAVHPVGCKTVLMEDPNTGADLGKAGSFSWIDTVPQELAESFKEALEDGKYDARGGGYYYFDAKENIWWSFDTAAAILKKFPAIVKERNLGGVFAWGLGEDGMKYEHLNAMTKGVRSLSREYGHKGEL